MCSTSLFFSPDPSLPISKLSEMFPLAGDAFGALGEVVWNGDASDLQVHSSRNGDGVLQVWDFFIILGMFAI